MLIIYSPSISIILFLKEVHKDIKDMNYKEHKDKGVYIRIRLYLLNKNDCILLNDVGHGHSGQLKENHVVMLALSSLSIIKMLIKSGKQETKRGI